MPFNPFYTEKHDQKNSLLSSDWAVLLEVFRNFRIESLSLPAFLFIKTSPHKPWDSNIIMTSSEESEKKSNTNEF